MQSATESTFESKTQGLVPLTQAAPEPRSSGTPAAKKDKSFDDVVEEMLKRSPQQQTHSVGSATQSAIQAQSPQTRERQMVEKIGRKVVEGGKPVSKAGTRGSTPPPPKTILGKATAQVTDGVGEARDQLVSAGRSAMLPVAGLAVGGATGWVAGSVVGGQLQRRTA